MNSLGHIWPDRCRCLPAASSLAFHWGAKLSIKSSTSQNNSSTLISSSLRWWIEVLCQCFYSNSSEEATYPELTLNSPDPGMEMSRSLLIPPSSFDALLRLLMKRCQLELSLPERFEEKCLLLENLLARLDANSEFYRPGRASGGANLGVLRRWLAEEGIPSESSQWVY